jgi:outer membrane protein
MNKLLSIILILSASILVAQEQQQFDLDQCIKYAIANHESIVSSQLDIRFADADVKEAVGIGLPQISANGELNYFYEIPTTLIPSNTFNPFAPADEFDELQFGTKFNTKIGVTASQLIFSGSYLVGLKVVKGYKELMVSAMNKTKIDVAESVTKAYYNVLMMNERVEMLDASLNLMDSLLIQNEGLFKAGFIEEIEVNKAEVTLNNLKIEKVNFDRMKELSYQLLKFQMGMPVKEPLEVAENLAAFEIPILDDAEQVNVEGRVEYRMMAQENGLYTIEKKLNQTAYLPSLAAFVNHSYSSQVNDFGDTFTGKWYPTGILGAQLNIPIFSGFQNKAKVQKSVINIERTENNMSMFKKSAELQVSQASISLKSSISGLESRKSNMELAEKVYKNTITKNKLGVSSVIEVTSAFTEYKTAQTNYYDGLYDVIVSKIELDKAKGELKY